MVSQNKIREIASSNPTAESMFLEWAIRLRHRPKMDIRRFRVRLKQKMGDMFNEKDYRQTLRSLAAAHVGRIERSTQGNLRYFHFRESVKALGQVGVEGNQSAHPKAAPTRPARVVKTYPEGTKETLVLVVPRTAGGLVRFNLPTGTTGDDIDAIIATLSEVKEVNV